MKAMFRWFLVATVSLGCLVSAAEPAPAPKTQGTRFVIGLSPFLDKSVKDDVYRRIVGFLLEDLPQECSLWLYDAYDLRTITQVNIPGVRAFRSSKTRANQFKEQIGKLRDFLAADHPQPAGSKVPLDQAVRLPQFLDFIADNLVSAGQPIVVIVLGSPLYRDPKEPGFSMVDGYFPSDGNLMASRDQSVYGLKTRKDALKDIVVHFGYFGDPWVSEVHQEKICRFWALYLQGQGARLATFCGDLPTVFNAARGAASTPPPAVQRYALDPAQSKIEMLRITRDLGVADWITREVVSNPQLTPPSVTVGPMKIGIRWKGRIDLDLYASPNSRAETLFFEHTRSPEGYYNHDYRSSPDQEYEFIEFTSPVDVNQVEASVNFYKGNAPGGPSGEIRIEFEGKIYTGHFAVVAEHGNEGRAGRNQGEFWARIDVPAILKLRTLHIDPGVAQRGQ